MMPKINLDEDETLSEPIEIIIEGKTFVVPKITDKKFKKVAELTSVAEQFALLTGAKLSIVQNLNLMKVAKAIQYIIQTIVGSMGMETGQALVRKETEDKETEVKND
jgi:hypothetical protein